MHLQHLKTINNLNEIAQSSLTVGPCSYGILDITSENIKYSTQSLDTGKGDSINYFKNVAYQKTYNHLIAEGVETDMARMMAEFFAEINYAYFTGNLNSIDINYYLEGINNWKAYNQDSLTYYYLESLEKELNTNMNYLIIPLKK